MPRPARVHPDRSPDGRMTLAEHLYELRRRVIISVIAILIFTIVAYLYHVRLLYLLTHPYCRLPVSYRLNPDKCTLYASGVQAGGSAQDSRTSSCFARLFILSIDRGLYSYL